MREHVRIGARLVRTVGIGFVILGMVAACLLGPYSASHERWSTHPHPRGPASGRQAQRQTTSPVQPAPSTLPAPTDARLQCPIWLGEVPDETWLMTSGAILRSPGGVAFQPVSDQEAFGTAPYNGATFLIHWSRAAGCSARSVDAGVVSLISIVGPPPDDEPLIAGLEGCGALQPVAVGMDRVLLHERNCVVRLFYVGVDEVVDGASAFIGPTDQLAVLELSYSPTAPRRPVDVAAEGVARGLAEDASLLSIAGYLSEDEEEAAWSRADELGALVEPVDSP